MHVFPLNPLVFPALQSRPGHLGDEPRISFGLGEIGSEVRPTEGEKNSYWC